MVADVLEHADGDDLPRGVGTRHYSPLFDARHSPPSHLVVGAGLAVLARRPVVLLHVLHEVRDLGFVVA